jgi:hypothetical protein
MTDRELLEAAAREGTHREVPLYMAPPDHREVMQQALDVLEYININCGILADYEGPLEQVIPALQAALDKCDALDRLAQANRELGLYDDKPY